MDDKSLDALFTGLTEIPAPTTPKEETAPQPAKAKDKKGKDKKEKSAIPYRARQKQQELEHQEERLCTIVSSELVRKIRIIASLEGLTIRKVVEAAFMKAISSYERKHGEITEDTKKSLKDLF